MLKLKPLEDRIVVKPNKQEKTTSSGIVLPENTKEKPQCGKVMCVGPGRRNDQGEYISLEIVVGCTVLYSKYAGTECKIDGEEYLILRASDCLAIMPSEE